ncbi:MAG: ABC transporter ATP-binding protein [Phenylobacterium sp.]|uniref:ABC transporter ATP-binding protein n=1 Tax=Phenylobacterium sp. TaxID=1871053 RepID=UPI00391D12F5
MAGVSLENLVKRFGDTPVIRGINLTVQDGEFVVFVGPSGCGKSTLLRLIAGLEDATSGTIRIGEEDVTRIAPARRGVSMVFQSYALYPHMDVYRNIAFGLKLAGASKADTDARVRRVADMLQIAPLLKRRPRELSGGQRQRVAIARAIVREPKVFLFDEPLSNLDAALRAQTRLEIARMHEDLAATMVYVTHDQLEAMTLADRIVLLNAGHIEQVGTPTELYHRPATRFAAEFMGSPTMNILPVTLEGDAAVLSTGERVSLPAAAPGGKADLGVRPENIALADTGLAARVMLVEELGEARIVHAELADGAVLAVRHGADGPQPSRHSPVKLRLDPERLHLFGQDGARLDLGV